ncbi:hypothetical protein BDM02DRAFT_3087445 [Thelephora ganbajun]|uniref:Uncharacterized protein n=1 Tax=Thelephora ganbajun TaxID=370292 RepID=A0ACB6ZVG2_THEGA|nr:hypothetical protein BDM02DRAFT_3087445 [Thelephora ganbajun]
MPDIPTPITASPVARLKPLIGDGSGRYRILIVGNSGTDRTTLGARLSKLLNIPHTSLDTLHWGPSWRACPADEFRAKVQEKLNETAETGWIIDGSYVSKIGNIVKDSATDIIWLDPPFLMYFPRICYRTFARLIGYEEPCSPGCDESWRDVFALGEKSILWWSWTNHDPFRQRQQADMMNEGLRAKTRRLCGWGGELEDWIKDIREMIRTV